jgi:hypothetical protein
VSCPLPAAHCLPNWYREMGISGSLVDAFCCLHPRYSHCLAYRTKQEHQIGSRRVTGGPSPFKQKTAVLFIEPRFLSRAHTQGYTGSSLRRACSDARVVLQGCLLSARKPSIDAVRADETGALPKRQIATKTAHLPGGRGRPCGADDFARCTSRAVIPFMTASSSSVW